MSSHLEADHDAVDFDDLFQVDEKRFAGSQFILELVRTFQNAYSEEKRSCGLTQQAVADRLNLAHRSIVNRWLRGQENMNARTMAELAWALGYDAELVLRRRGEHTQKSTSWAAEATVVSAPTDNAWKRHAPKDEKAKAILENV